MKDFSENFGKFRSVKTLKILIIKQKLAEEISRFENLQKIQDSENVHK